MIGRPKDQKPKRPKIIKRPPRNRKATSIGPSRNEGPQGRHIECRSREWLRDPHRPQHVAFSQGPDLRWIEPNGNNRALSFVFHKHF